jgi:ribose transport system permease protein
MRVLAARLIAWMIPLVAILSIILLTVVQPRFLTSQNLLNVFRQSSFLAVVALGQMFTILTKGLDLSQGGIVTITSVCFALVANAFGTGTGVVVGLAMGILAGLLNGALVAWVEISPFVATLGVGFALQGMALIASNGQPVSDVPANFASLAWGHLGLLPLPFAIALLVFAFCAVALMLTVPGRFIYAVGSNDRAAMLAGIPVKLVLLSAYAISGGLSALGAVLLSSRIDSGHPTAGQDTALQAIAAVVIGGVSLFGGRGSPVGVLLGALYLGFLGNALNLLNVSSYVQQVVVGTAIIVAVSLDRFRVLATDLTINDPESHLRRSW